MNINTTACLGSYMLENVPQAIEAYDNSVNINKQQDISIGIDNLSEDKLDNMPIIEYYSNYSKTGILVDNTLNQQESSSTQTVVQKTSNNDFIHFGNSSSDIKAWNEWVDPVRQQKDDLVNKIYGQRAAESNRTADPFRHAWDRYFNPKASHYVGHDLNDSERHLAFYNEYSLMHGNIKRIGSSDVDPIFEGRGLTTSNRRGGQTQSQWTRGIIATGFRSTAGLKLNNRNMITSQLNDLFNRNGIQIPENLRLSFQIDSQYNLVVKGTEDENLIKQIEELLNKNGNSFQLYRHIMDSTRTVGSDRYTDQIREDSLRLYRIDNSIRRYTDYNRQDLDLVDGKFLTKDGVDIMEYIKKGMGESFQGQGGVLIENMQKELQWLAEVGPENIPEMILAIDFENGSLFDIGQPHGYGPGQTNWISDLLGGKDPFDNRSWL